jgi:hypothetical protein
LTSSRQKLAAREKTAARRPRLARAALQFRLQRRQSLPRGDGAACATVDARGVREAAQ